MVKFKLERDEGSILQIENKKKCSENSNLEVKTNNKFRSIIDSFESRITKTKKNTTLSLSSTPTKRGRENQESEQFCTLISNSDNIISSDLIRGGRGDGESPAKRRRYGQNDEGGVQLLRR